MPSKNPRISYAVVVDGFNRSVHRYEDGVMGARYYSSSNPSYCIGVAQFLNERAQYQRRNIADGTTELVMTKCPTCKKDV